MDDLISRSRLLTDLQETLEAWSKYPVMEEEIKGIEVAIAYVKSIPSAQRTGEWILKEHLWECDQCGCRINREYPLSGNIWNYYYCPNCGAEMRGEANGGDNE